MSPEALLLIGPTGSGKSPLGDLFEQRGIAGRRCLHFDFGSRLRAVAAGPRPEEFEPVEHSFIQEVLHKGLLLENEHFHIAEKIVLHFLKQRGCGPGDLMILNGLPRHRDQAKDMGRLARIVGLIVLDCTPEDVCTRIRLNSGGDRTGRPDDDMELVTSKLRIFRDRTEPLIEYFSSAGVPVARTAVQSHTTAEDIYEGLCSAFARNI